MGSMTGGRPTNTRTDMTTNTSSTQTGGSTSNYDPWVSDLSRQFGQAAGGAAMGWQAPPTTDLYNGVLSNASNMSGRVPGAYDQAQGYLGQDRGAGYAQSALDQLLHFSGGDTNSSSWGMSGGPAGGGAFSGGPVRDAKWNDFTNFDINKYMNPYNEGVINSTLSDIDRQSATAANDRASAAAAAHAFGGSRHGVMDAVAAGETARAKGSVEAQLRDQAYKDAAARIQGDQQGQFGASAANQGADVAKRGQDINYATSMAGLGATERSNAASLRLNALSQLLNGGLGLGGLDINHGQAWQGFGSDLYGRSAGTAVDDRNFNRDSSFDQLRALGMGGGILGGLPLDRSQMFGTSNTGSTHQYGTGNTQQGASGSDNLSGLLALAAMFYGGGGG